MGGFGQTLFARSPFIRLSLTPVLVVFAASLPFMTELNSPLRIGLVAAMDAA